MDGASLCSLVDVLAMNKLLFSEAVPRWFSGKESTSNTGDVGSIPGLGRSPGEGNDHPLQYSCLENPHGQRSLTGYSPWGHKESDTTEHARMHKAVPMRAQ